MLAARSTELIMKIPKTIKYPWQSRKNDRHRIPLHVLPGKIGDGKQLVLLSFYAAPELAVCIRFDSKLPLDLPDNERFKDSDVPRSFRDYVDDIYDKLEAEYDQPPVPRYRLKELNEEAALEVDDPDDRREPWSLIIESGSTWSLL